jgi:ribosomal protein L11 methyltransferase
MNQIPPQKWMNLTLKIPKECFELLSELALEKGANSVWIHFIPNEDGEDLTSITDHQEIGVTITLNSNVDIKVFLKDLCAAFGLKPIENFKLHSFEDTDWVSHTQKLHLPIKINNSLWICPSWEKVTDKQSINIILDPGMAFGTGTHPTTQLCLDWITKYASHYSSLLDYGSGTGILGIAAYKFGVETVSAVDIDKNALCIAKENSIRNNSKLDIRFPHHAIHETFDIVIANILANTLIQLKHTLTSHVSKNGFLILSGIQISQSQKVINEYEDLVTLKSLKVQEDWVLLGGETIN